PGLEREPRGGAEDGRAANAQRPVVAVPAAQAEHALAAADVEPQRLAPHAELPVAIDGRLAQVMPGQRTSGLAVHARRRVDARLHGHAAEEGLVRNVETDRPAGLAAGAEVER